MSYYIWTKNGVEVSRKERTRGRPPIGAKQGSDGNFYIETTEVPQKQSSSSVSTKTTSTVNTTPVVKTELTIVPIKPVEEVEKDTTGVVTKSYKEKFPALPEHIISCLWWETRHYHEKENVISIEQPVVINKCVLEHIKYNAHYARLDIDKIDKTVKIWSNYPYGEPNYVLKDALV